MREQNLKYVIGIVLIIIIDSLHNIFFENNDKYDVYALYDHPRYLTNILLDISNLFKFSILTYWLIPVNDKIFKPLFLLSLLIWVSYFITYNQITSLLVLPVYGVLIYYFNKKKLLKWVTKFLK